MDKIHEQYVMEARDAEDIKRLRALPEFRAMDRLLKNVYRRAVENIVIKESVEDRAKIAFITELFDSMDYDLRLGEDASRYLAEQKLNQTPSTNTD